MTKFATDYPPVSRLLAKYEPVTAWKSPSSSSQNEDFLRLRHAFWRSSNSHVCRSARPPPARSSFIQQTAVEMACLARAGAITAPFTITHVSRANYFYPTCQRATNLAITNCPLAYRRCLEIEIHGEKNRNRPTRLPSRRSAPQSLHEAFRTPTNHPYGRFNNKIQPLRATRSCENLPSSLELLDTSSVTTPPNTPSFPAHRPSPHVIPDPLTPNSIPSLSRTYTPLPQILLLSNYRLSVEWTM